MLVQDNVFPAAVPKFDGILLHKLIISLWFNTSPIEEGTIGTAQIHQVGSDFGSHHSIRLLLFRQPVLDNSMLLAARWVIGWHISYSSLSSKQVTTLSMYIEWIFQRFSVLENIQPPPCCRAASFWWLRKQ
eukprot:TRINITY_DN4656_c0_g1_i2.p1 TRINITY_DN4656_c0_g1~~TRINITY_DN4656_c0_g1_i2.p1  ORF type:complete len:131 (-),score=7.45 TRINITY_DN4656_c0_g1_i2:165-557(-)